jgi:urease accessory protein
MLDNDLDASTPCTVARRASVAQGRALLSVWDRALRSAAQGGCERAGQALAAFAAQLKRTVGEADDIAVVNGHFALVWAVVCRAMGLGLEQMVYVFLFNHAKAVLSSAVRASAMGPYQAQGILASVSLQDEIAEAVRGNWGVAVEDAAQVVPVLDLWVGRHELLYSRIFNS